MTKLKSDIIKNHMKKMILRKHKTLKNCIKTNPINTSKRYKKLKKNIIVGGAVADDVDAEGGGGDAVGDGDDDDDIKQLILNFQEQEKNHANKKLVDENILTSLSGYTNYVEAELENFKKLQNTKDANSVEQGKKDNLTDSYKIFTNKYDAVKKLLSSYESSHEVFIDIREYLHNLDLSMTTSYNLKQTLATKPKDIINEIKDIKVNLTETSKVFKDSIKESLESISELEKKNEELNTDIKKTTSNIEAKKTEFKTALKELKVIKTKLSSLNSSSPSSLNRSSPNEVLKKYIDNITSSSDDITSSSDDDVLQKLNSIPIPSETVLSIEYDNNSSEIKSGLKNIKTYKNSLIEVIKNIQSLEAKNKKTIGDIENNEKTIENKENDIEKYKKTSGAIDKYFQEDDFKESDFINFNEAIKQFDDKNENYEYDKNFEETLLKSIEKEINTEISFGTFLETLKNKTFTNAVSSVFILHNQSYNKQEFYTKNDKQGIKDVIDGLFQIKSNYAKIETNIKIMNTNIKNQYSNVIFRIKGYNSNKVQDTYNKSVAEFIKYINLLKDIHEDVSKSYADFTNLPESKPSEINVVQTTSPLDTSISEYISKIEDLIKTLKDCNGDSSCYNKCAGTNEILIRVVTKQEANVESRVSDGDASKEVTMVQSAEENNGAASGEDKDEDNV